MKMKTSSLKFPAFALGMTLLLLGTACDKPTDVSAAMGTSTNGTGAPGTVPTPKDAPTTRGLTSDTGKKTGEGAATTGDTSQPSDMPPPGMPLSSVPADLQTEAYHYYGLDRAEPEKLVLKRKDQPDSTGTQYVRLTKVGDMVATFEATRTGDLSLLGSETLELRKDGIYGVAMSTGTISRPSMELPSNPTPGRIWPADEEVSTGTDKLSIKGTYKVLGTEKVHTVAGDLDALHVHMDAQFKSGSQQGTMKEDAWYVKGYGAVKLSIVQKPKSGAEQTMSVELAK